VKERFLKLLDMVTHASVLDPPWAISAFIEDSLRTSQILLSLSGSPKNVRVHRSAIAL